jgi:hypothetical protein
VKKESNRDRPTSVNATSFDLDIGNKTNEAMESFMSRPTRGLAEDDFFTTAKNFVVDFVNDENFDVYVFTFITVATVFITLWRSFMFFNVST